ncbi:Maf1 regulator, partial [Lineolata rhizophorae]
QYVSTPEFEFVTGALNFDTADCRIEGGCDLYTTRAAGADKKLYKNIEHTLESQHESILRLSASLSPPQADALAPSLNLSRSSPFGPLSQISSRRTFAYLIATLNASHPDYDFSYTLRPTDFRKERSLRGVMNTIDSTLFNLRPRTSGALLAVPMSATGVQMPGGTSTWGPRMWQLIDKEISLRDCAVYCYSPEEDPMDGEDGAIWSLNYFFFNKAIKRVCYIYLRALSIISHSPASTSKRKKSSRNSLSIGSSAGKRAKYWLGDMAEGVDTSGDWGEEDDDDMVIEEPGDDEVD